VRTTSRKRPSNALKYGMVPVVHGPSRETYERLLPPHSFIHVGDFPTLKDLAEYILHLDKNEEEYRKYFRWKVTQTIDPIYYFPAPGALSARS